VGGEDDGILLRPLTVLGLELQTRTPWLPGLAGQEQLQAVLQVGEQTWEPSSSWLTFSTQANGRSLPFLARHLCPEDHVSLLLVLSNGSNLGLILLVSTCLSWEGRQEALPCPSVLLVAVSLSFSPPPGLWVSWCLSSSLCALLSLPPFPASRRSPHRPEGRWLAPPWAAVRGLARGGWLGSREGASRLVWWLEVTRSCLSHGCLPTLGPHLQQGGASGWALVALLGS
jgi:hypothetical protein